MANLDSFIEEQKDTIAHRWSEKVGKRLGLDQANRPQLINEMPEVLTDLVDALRQDPRKWRSSSGRLHARQRIGLGLDIGGLAEEFSLIGETILELIAEHELSVEPGQSSLMLRFLGKCTSESVTEYARLSSLELQRQSAETFSFVAHELRTPLQAARLALSLASDSSPETPGLDRLSGSLQRLSSLIDNSLVEARLTAEPTIRKEEIRSTELVSDATQQSMDLAKQRGIELKTEAEDFVFDADHRLMMSALTNLIVNGIKFSKRGGSVLIKAELHEERVHLEVHDSCGGLPEGAPARMFRQFSQVGRDRSGFGLGLLIVRQAIEAHGGRVRVVNRPGTGCQMLVELPRRQSRHSSYASRQ